MSDCLVYDILTREIGIPQDDADNLIYQIVTIHPPKLAEPESWSVLYVQLSSQNMITIQLTDISKSSLKNTSPTLQIC